MSVYGPDCQSAWRWNRQACQRTSEYHTRKDFANIWHFDASAHAGPWYNEWNSGVDMLQRAYRQGKAVLENSQDWWILSHAHQAKASHTSDTNAFSPIGSDSVSCTHTHTPPTFHGGLSSMRTIKIDKQSFTSCNVRLKEKKTTSAAANDCQGSYW